MAKAAPTLDQVKRILGNYAIAPVRNWLRRCELPHTMNSREEMAKRVQELLEGGDITEDALIEASISIEEASSKRVFIYKVGISPTELKAIDDQIAALGIPLSNERTPSTSPTATSKLIYAINTPTSFRAKWNEQHVRITADKRHKKFTETNQPKIIVLVLNKETGIAQLRLDKPDDRHSHVIDNEPSDQAYFDYYKEKAENTLGLPLEPIEFRNGLEKVLKAEPRIVRTNHTVDDAADGSYTKRTQKKAGADIRDTAEWKRIAADNSRRTFEEAPLRWIPEMSNGRLTRELFSDADAANGYIRFDADCYEEEIDYAISHLV
jgi:hypothetical protein